MAAAGGAASSTTTSWRGGSCSATWKISWCTWCASTPALGEQGLGARDHAVRPAQVPLVDGRDGRERVEDAAHALGVEPAGEQLDVLRLA